MVFLNYSTMQMVAKIVYYGPGLCGKTTNLKEIYRKTSNKSRGEMVSLETETDRTLFFDLLPMDVGVIGGFKTKFQLYTVPGQVFYNSTRKLVLRGVDGIVFVADSQVPMLEANQNSFENLQENLEELGLDLADIPLVFQFNKRDLPNICSVDELNAALNPEGNHPGVESAAIQGDGVFETLKAISKLTLTKLRDKALGNEPEPSREQVKLKVRDEEEVQKIRDELQNDEPDQPPPYEDHTAVQQRPSLEDLELAAAEAEAESLDDSVTLDEPDTDDLTLDDDETVVEMTPPVGTDGPLPAGNAPEDSIDADINSIALNDFDADDDLAVDSINLDEFQDLGDDDEDSLSDIDLNDDEPDDAASALDNPTAPLPVEPDAPQATAEPAEASTAHDDAASYDMDQDLGEADTDFHGVHIDDDDDDDDDDDPYTSPTVAMTAEEAMASIEIDDAENLTAPSIDDDTGVPSDPAFESSRDDDAFAAAWDQEPTAPPALDVADAGPPPIDQDEMMTEPVEMPLQDFDETEAFEQPDIQPAKDKQAPAVMAPHEDDSDLDATVDMLAAFAAEQGKADKSAKSQKKSSVDDLLSGLVGDKKKVKQQRLHMQSPGPYDAAQLECRLLDGEGHPVAVEQFAVDVVKLSGKKRQIKVSITIDQDA